MRGAFGVLVLFVQSCEGKWLGGQAYVKKDERWIWWLVYLFLVFVSLVNLYL
jgi:hypothetical protein